MRRRHYARGGPTLDGAGVIHHWEPSTDTVVLNGSNVSQLLDRVGGKHMTNAVGSTQPGYQAAGLLGRPCLNLQDNGRLIQSSALGIPSGTRPGIYAVWSSPGGAALRVTWQVVVDGANMFAQNASKYVVYAGFEVGTNQIYGINTPALTTSCVRGSIEFFSTGLLGRINGQDISPALTGNSPTRAMTSVMIGSSPSSGGKFGMLIIVGQATLAKRAIVEAYIASKFTLP